jgi:hypothetical protein
VCVVKTPKIQTQAQTDQQANKPLPILRNPLLDGLLGNIAALRSGTSAFRIDLLNPLTIPGGAVGGSAGGGSSASSSSGSSSSSSSGPSGQPNLGSHTPPVA